MILPVFIPHAGCPYQCIFCNQRTISGEQDSSLEGARRQIEGLLAWARPDPSNELAFYGGSFTALPMDRQRALLELAETYRARGLFGPLRLSTRPDAITLEILALLREHQVETIELGAQSLDDRVLAAARRGHTGAQVREASQLIRQEGFRLGLQLMVGLPGQGKESLAATCRQVVEIHPDLVRIYPVLVIAGTPLAELWRQGSYRALTVDEAAAACWPLYHAFTREGIRVIRMGLQPDRELCAPGHILAGPFHPAFGEKVKSWGIGQQVLRKIAEQPSGNYNMVITCPDKMASLVRGQHRSNVRLWEQTGKVRVFFQTGETFEVMFHDRKTL